MLSHRTQPQNTQESKAVLSGGNRKTVAEAPPGALIHQVILLEVLLTGRTYADADAYKIQDGKERLLVQDIASFSAAEMSSCTQQQDEDRYCQQVVVHAAPLLK